MLVASGPVTSSVISGKEEPPMVLLTNGSTVGKEKMRGRNKNIC